DAIDSVHNGDECVWLRERAWDRDGDGGAGRLGGPLLHVVAVPSPWHKESDRAAGGAVTAAGRDADVRRRGIPMWHPRDGEGHLGESRGDRASRTGTPDAVSRRCRAGAVDKYDQLLGEPDAGEQRDVAAGVGRVRDY